MNDTDSTSPQARLDRFCTWMKGQGIKWDESKMELRWDTGVCEGYGVVAKSQVNERDHLCTIPKTVVLSVHTSPIAELLAKNSLEGGMGVAVALLHEWTLGEQSHWFPYLQVMPQHVDLPLNWTSEEISLLQGTQCATSVEKDRERANHEWTDIVQPLIKAHPDLFDEEISTYAHYIRALSLFASRAFQVDKYHGDSMLPLADTFNHCAAGEHVHIEGPEEDADDEGDNEEGEEKDPKTLESEGDSASQALDISVVKGAVAGEELFNTFGERPNSSLLCKYGFAELKNPFDTAHLSFDLVQKVIREYIGENQMKSRMELVESHADFFVGDEVDSYTLADDGSFCEPLMLMLYVMFAPDKVVKPWKKDSFSMLETLQSIDMDTLLSEPKICDTLTTLVTQRLALYPDTKLADDEAKIAKLAEKPSKELTTSERREFYALLVRAGEKRALKKAYSSVFETQDESSEEEEEEEEKCQKRENECDCSEKTCKKQKK